MIRLTFDDGFVLFMYYPEVVTFVIVVWLSHFIRLLMLFHCHLNLTGYTCVKHLPAYSSTLTLFQCANGIADGRHFYLFIVKIRASWPLKRGYYYFGERFI